MYACRSSSEVVIHRNRRVTQVICSLDLFVDRVVFEELAGLLDTTVGYLLGESEDHDLFKDFHSQLLYLPSEIQVKS